MLAGRTLADVALNCLSLVVLFAVGFVVGFNFIDASVLDVVAGIVLLLLFGYAFSWIFALVGLYSSLAGDRERDRLHADLPAHVRVVGVRAGRVDAGRAAAVRRGRTRSRRSSDAVRSLWLGTPAHTDVWMAFVWCTVLIAIFAPLAVARYRTVAAK